MVGAQPVSRLAWLRPFRLHFQILAERSYGIFKPALIVPKPALNVLPARLPRRRFDRQWAPRRLRTPLWLLSSKCTLGDFKGSLTYHSNYRRRNTRAAGTAGAGGLERKGRDPVHWELLLVPYEGEGVLCLVHVHGGIAEESAFPRSRKRHENSPRWDLSCGGEGKFGNWG